MHVNPADPRHAQALQRLLQIMNELRSQCPWDKQQTLESLRHLTIEETYELGDAILQNDLAEIKAELGDLMLHIVFYAKLGAEQDAFDFADVLTGICDKLVRRHPHVYGDSSAPDEAAVKRRWELLKLEEKGQKSSVLAGVPTALPALIKARRLQQKVHGVGFDWENAAQVWDKVQEELGELQAHLDPNGQLKDAKAAEHEFGDLLFSLVNYARFVGLDPEAALEKTNLRFMRRFQHLEQAARADGKNLHELSATEMDTYWEAAKIVEKLGFSRSVRSAQSAE